MIGFNIDYISHPKSSLYDLVKQYKENFLILDDVLATPESHAMVYQDILDIMKYAFEYKVFREMPIHFKIHRNDKKMYILQARHFLSNMILWYAYVDMECTDIMDESFIMDWHNKNMKDIGNFIDTNILPYHDGDFHSKNKVVDEIWYHITAIAKAFCLLMGYGISSWDIMQAEKENPRIHELLYESPDLSMQPKEMEEYMNSRTKELIKLFGEADSDLRPLLLSGKNISEKQFREIFLHIGYKSDFSARTIPWLVEANIAITGINKPSYLLIDAFGGRNAIMNTKLSMSKPGALSKKLNAATTSVRLREDYEDCHSTRPIYYVVKDDTILRMLDKRYYYDERGNLKLLDYRKDKHLIGKTIPVRSPVTCASKDGICHICYGELFDINKDLYSAGALAAVKDSEPIGQLVLSFKHVNQTNSEEIQFNEDFYKAFELVSNEIVLTDEMEEAVASLSMKLGPIHVEETDDGDVYFVEYLDLVNSDGEVKYHIEEETKTPLYLSNHLYIIYKQMRDKPIPFSRLDDEDDFIMFNIEVKSEAAMHNYQMITTILDSNDHLGCKDDIDAMCNKMGEIMLDSNINYNFVHHEMIIRGLVRRKSDETQYPDFGPNGDHDDYKIMRLTAALSSNPSPLVRLSTGWLKKNLIGTSLYKVNEVSHLDPLFVPVLLDVVDNDD